VWSQTAVFWNRNMCYACASSARGQEVLEHVTAITFAMASMVSLPLLPGIVSVTYFSPFLCCQEGLDSWPCSCTTLGSSHELPHLTAAACRCSRQAGHTPADHACHCSHLPLCAAARSLNCSCGPHTQDMYTWLLHHYRLGM
jgi:hypothetical protein